MSTIWKGIFVLALGSGVEDRVYEKNIDTDSLLTSECQSSFIRV